MVIWLQVVNNHITPFRDICETPYNADRKSVIDASNAASPIVAPLMLRSQSLGCGTEPATHFLTSIVRMKEPLGARESKKDDFPNRKPWLHR